MIAIAAMILFGSSIISIAIAISSINRDKRLDVISERLWDIQTEVGKK